MKNEDTTMSSLTETAAPADTAAADHVQSDPQAPLAQPTRQPVRAILESNALLMLVVVIGIFFAILPKSRGTFLSASNLAYLLGNQATVALLALAAILPLICGYFDFSVGANSALATVFAAGLMSHHGVPLGVACVAVIAIGALIGLINGIVVTRFRLNAFVATLGMATLLSGIIQWYTGGQTILAGISPTLVNFGNSNLFGIPEVVYVVVLIAAALWYLLSHTPYGRSLYAVGANPRAAQLVGIRSARYATVTFVLAGAIAGVVGVLQLARTGSATASDGTSLLFPALAAAFLGATAVRPGFFNVWGTLIGVLFVAVAVSGLTLAGASTWVSPVFNGIALLAAVGLSTWLGRHRGRTS